MAARPEVFSRYVPQFEGVPPESIDVDLDFVLDGIFEFKARSTEAYQKLKSVFQTYGKYDVGIVVGTSRNSYNVLDRTGLLLFPTFPNERSEPIFNENDEVVGHRGIIDVNSLEDLILDSTEDDIEVMEDGLGVLEDLILLGTNDYLEVYFILGVEAHFLQEHSDLLEYMHVDFFNTFAPRISTDTPGVTFVLADSPGIRDVGSPLQVHKVDSESVVISWPSVGVGELQKSGNLDTNSWEPVDQPPQDNGVLKTLVVPVGNENTFYRLNPNAPTESSVEGADPEAN